MLPIFLPAKRRRRWAEIDLGKNITKAGPQPAKPPTWRLTNPEPAAGQVQLLLPSQFGFAHPPLFVPPLLLFPLFFDRDTPNPTKITGLNQFFFSLFFLILGFDYLGRRYNASGFFTCTLLLTKFSSVHRPLQAEERNSKDHQTRDDLKDSDECFSIKFHVEHDLYNESSGPFINYVILPGEGGPRGE